MAERQAASSSSMASVGDGSRLGHAETRSPSDRGSQPESKKKVQSAFQFSSRAEAEAKVEAGNKDLNDIRALQRAKYQQHKADPNAKSAEAYNRPASFSAGAAPEEAAWYDPFGWFSGGGGSNPPPPRPNNRRQPPPGGPRIKTVGDLPKPVQSS